MSDETSDKDDKAGQAKAAAAGALDKIKSFDIKKVGGIDWAQINFGYLAGLLAFSLATFFVFAALIAPIWERPMLLLNTRFTMFCGIVGCALVLIGVPIKLGKILAEKKDMTEIKGFPAWVTLTAAWNVTILILVQLLCTGGLLGLLDKRGAWLPTQMFGPKSFVTRIFSDTLGMGGVIGWAAEVKLGPKAMQALTTAANLDDMVKLEAAIENHPELLRYRSKGELNSGLMALLSAGKPEALRIFGKQVDLSETDPKGNTVLHEAVRRFLPGPMVRVLVEIGCDLDAKNEEGKTPLHVATKHATYLVPLDYLLFKKADMNAQDNEGNTPLHLAAMGKNSKQVALLIARGADVTIKNKEGQTALDAAQQVLSDIMTKTGVTRERTPLNLRQCVHSLEHVEDIKSSQTPSEWVALMSKKGTMWFYDPSSWNWAGADLEFKFQLRKGEEVIKDQTVRVLPGEGSVKLHPSYKSKDLPKLTGGAKTILNTFIASIPKENIVRVDPRWTADPEFDWDAAFKK